MNNWLKLAVFALVGVIVSSFALGATASVNDSSINPASMNMGTMNSPNMKMGTTNSGNMNMGTTNSGNMNMGGMAAQYMPDNGGYAINPGIQGGINPMQGWMFGKMNQMRNWAGYPNHNMNQGQMNMYNQGMNMQSNMSGMGMM